jgi:hypothetical protein
MFNLTNKRYTKYNYRSFIYNNIKCIYKNTLIYFAIILQVSVFGCACTDSRNTLSEFIINKDTISIFRMYYTDGAFYYELNPDGNYIEYKYHTESSPIKFEIDRGKWKQGYDGIIEFCSSSRCADIVRDELQIRIEHIDNIKELPALRDKIESYLGGDAGIYLNIENIDTHYSNQLLCDRSKVLLWTCRLASHAPIPINVDVGTPVIMYLEMNSDTDRKEISKYEIKSLVSDIDRFVCDPSMRIRRAIPMKYLNNVFLLWLNCNTYSNRNVNRICRDVEKYNNSSRAPFHYFMISRDQYEKDMDKNTIWPHVNTIIDEAR